MPKTETINPFKGNAELVIRALFAGPDQSSSGRDLARHLDLSQAWVNRVLTALESSRLVQRNTQGPSSETKLIKPAKLLHRWTLEYRIDLNPYHLYLDRHEDPLTHLRELAEQEGFRYALTGYAAANLIKKIIHGDFPPMLYLWPNKGSKVAFEDMLLKLENVHQLVPVKKHANLIILQPLQKDRVFFGAKEHEGYVTVSPLQLFLDLYALDRGAFVIKELKDYWEEHGIPYEL